MKNEKYESIVNKYKAHENRTLNAFMAFIVGGLVGLLREVSRITKKYKKRRNRGFNKIYRKYRFF